VKYELRNSDGSQLREGHSIVDNKTFQIATVRSGPNREPSGTKIYTHKFTPELAFSALKLAHGSYTDHYHGCSLALMKEGAPNPIGVMDAKLWAEAPFDELWEQQSRPAPQINVSGKDLLNYVKHDRESKENHSQYL
jgi:hypothetical protein